MTAKKLLVVSDIHGAMAGAELVLDALRTHNPDLILCLGDILYHGPRNDLPATYAPKQVIPIMNGLKDRIIAVRGNCEAEVDQMVLEFPVMGDYNILPFLDRKIFMSHGHVYGPAKLPVLNEGDIFLSGHTHIPTAHKKDGIYLSYYFFPLFSGFKRTAFISLTLAPFHCPRRIIRPHTVCLMKPALRYIRQTIRLTCILTSEKHGPAEAEPLFSFVSECLDRIEVGSLVARQDAEQDADSH